MMLAIVIWLAALGVLAGIVVVVRLRQRKALRLAQEALDAAHTEALPLNVEHDGRRMRSELRRQMNERAQDHVEHLAHRHGWDERRKAIEFLHLLRKEMK